MTSHVSGKTTRDTSFQSKRIGKLDQESENFHVENLKLSLKFA